MVFALHRYMSGESASTKQNITWAGQTLGTDFHVADGRLNNPINVVTVPCTGGSCRIPMRAPSFALVFLSDQSLNDVTPTGPETATFPTTVTTRRHGQVFVDPSVLATSNGDGGAQELLKAQWQATSEGSVSSGMRVGVSLGVVVGVLVGGVVTLLGARA